MKRVSVSIARPLVWLVIGYQHSLSRVLPPSCRYEPSCSWYTREALERHGAFRGGWLAVKRLSRCRPGGGRGHDPVPD
jgi:putative membrane protein insertion efficiency factor